MLRVAATALDWRCRAGITLIAWALRGRALLAPIRPLMVTGRGVRPRARPVRDRNARLAASGVVEAGWAARIGPRIVGVLAALWLAAAAAMRR